MTGTVSVKTYFGSVVSSNGSGGYVIDCSSKADITVTGKGMVGGIVGVNEGTVYRCRFTGTLATETMNGVSYYGGIIGSNLGTVDSAQTTVLSGAALMSAVLRDKITKTVQ